MKDIYDIAVVGGGPAGLTAGLYGLRNGKSVLIIEKSVFGGQIVNSPKVENIPGFELISGDEFGDLFLSQVRKQGGDVTFDTVLSIDTDGDMATLNLELDDPVKARTVIIATGTVHRTLGLQNEEELIGKQIHFCAVCDGNFYQGKKVVMIGGGNSAFVEANLLAEVTAEVELLQDMPFFTADEKLQQQLLGRSNVYAHTGTKVLGYRINDGVLTGVRYLENGEEKVAECDGVFMAVGLIPDNKNFVNVVDLDERGYIRADETGITRTPNIFVAGDCRTKSLRQVATACADGANAAIAACEYLRK